MWIMIHFGQEVRYRTDHILETDCCLFQNLATNYPKHNTNHYILLGCLSGVTHIVHMTPTLSPQVAVP